MLKKLFFKLSSVLMCHYCMCCMCLYSYFTWET